MDWRFFLKIVILNVQVELGAKAGALRQMLLELLDHPQDIRRITIMGRVCSIRREDGSIECSIPLDKKNAEGKR
jgi:magnesium transporter